MQLQIVQNLSLIQHNIKIASIATYFGLAWPTLGKCSFFETVELH
jgi:hypothetical protein